MQVRVSLGSGNDFSVPHNKLDLLFHCVLFFITKINCNRIPVVQCVYYYTGFTMYIQTVKKGAVNKLLKSSP